MRKNASILKKGKTDPSSVSATEKPTSRQTTITAAAPTTVSTLVFYSHSKIEIMYRFNPCAREGTAHTLLHTSGYSVLPVRGGSTVYVLKFNQGWHRLLNSIVFFALLNSGH